MKDLRIYLGTMHFKFVSRQFYQTLDNKFYRAFNSSTRFRSS